MYVLTHATRRVVALAACAAVAALGAVVGAGPGESAPARAEEPAAPATTDDLVNSTAQQEKWLSYPESRLTMHAANGAALPLDIGYIVSARTASIGRLVQTYVAAEGTCETACSQTQAASYSTVWRPEALLAEGAYTGGPAGAVSVADVFHDANSFSRVASPDLDGGVVVMRGEPNTNGRGSGYGNAVYYSNNKTMAIDSDGEGLYWVVVTDARYVYAVAFPAGIVPALVGGAWRAEYPASADAAVGVGFAVANAAVTGGDYAEAAKARASAALAGAAGERAAQKAFWDDFMAQVPAAQDYSVQDVALGGVDADYVKATYYKAWVELAMEIVPATPETGNVYRHLATTKAGMFNGGLGNAPWATGWDSYEGLQLLAHIPDYADMAWESMEGFMAFVDASGSMAHDLQGGGSEQLPAREAETIWGIYGATGDLDRLGSVFDALKRHLAWSDRNQCWVTGAGGGCGYSDMEFSVSLVYDYGYAAKIAMALGKTTDALEFVKAARDLMGSVDSKTGVNYRYFPTNEPGGGKVFTLYNRGEWRNQDGVALESVTDNPLYITSAFVTHDQGLEPEAAADALDSFLYSFGTYTSNPEGRNYTYNPDLQYAGVADWSIKGPDWQLTVYGLLGMDPALLDGTYMEGEAAQLRQYADVMINSAIRDITLGQHFYECYRANGQIGDIPGGHGTNPGNPWGAAMLIDAVLIANGYQAFSGGTAYTHLPNRQGGVTGLRYLGEPLTVDIDDDEIALTSEVLDDPVFAAAEGETVVLDLPQPELVPIEELTIVGPDELTQKAQGVAYSVEVSPSNATYADRAVSWSVAKPGGGPTDKATISADGVLRPVANGQVRVVATARDGSEVTASKLVAISGQNVAFLSVGKPVTASLYTRPAELAVDGDLTTRWEANTGLAWLRVDLGAPAALSWITAELEDACPSGFRFQYSNDDTSWTDIEVFTGFACYNHAVAQVSDESLAAIPPARYVRFQVDVKHGSFGTSIYEFSIDGDYVNPTPVTAVAVSGAGGAVAITRPGRTLQMTAAVSPADATDKRVDWAVLGVDGEPSELAEIDANGVLTPLADGRVQVVATAVGGEDVSGSVWIELSNQRPNLALNQPATASGGSVDPGLSVDGSYSTRWGGGPSGGWFEVELGRVEVVDQITVTFETARASSFVVETRVGQEDEWTTVASVGSTQADVALEVVFSPTPARYVRLAQMNAATGWGISIWEFEVYGLEVGLSFDLNGWDSVAPGLVEPGAVAAQYGQAVGALPVLEAEGFEFLGWNT
ncbi:MAG: discoidin domain-containing protein, partial [Bifidobacteriaceae bacterium]|nr:discoidin domain-containing protein [Bifidobacteriaceae bacterium]